MLSEKPVHRAPVRVERSQDPAGFRHGRSSSSLRGVLDLRGEVARLRYLPLDQKQIGSRPVRRFTPNGSGDRVQVCGDLAGNIGEDIAQGIQRYQFAFALFGLQSAQGCQVFLLGGLRPVVPLDVIALRLLWFAACVGSPAAMARQLGLFGLTPSFLA